MDSAPFVLPPYGLYGGWRVRGTNSYQPMMASVITTTLTTQLKNKEPDRNVNVTYYDRWFVIQAVDDDKPLSKISPFIIDRALKCAVETVQSVRCLRTRYTHTKDSQTSPQICTVMASTSSMSCVRCHRARFLACCYLSCTWRIWPTLLHSTT